MVPRPERLTSLYRLVVPLPVDVPAAQRRLLLRIERRTWLLVLVVGLTAVLGHVLVGMLAPGVLPSLVGHGLVTTAAAVPITGLLLRQAFTHAAAVARQQAARRAEQAEAARVEAALLVARTAAHRVNNALAPLAGYADVLAQHPAIQADPRLARYVTAALAGAKQAAAEIARLQRIVRLEEDTTISLEPPILDLDRSTASESGATEAPGEPDSGGP